VDTISWKVATSPAPFDSEDLHVWRYHLDPPAAKLPEAESVLSRDEMDRATRFRFSIHRNRYVASRAQLRKILGGYLLLPASAISFIYSEFGRPSLQPALNSAGIAFNLSHSEDLCVVAVSARRLLGIDVERLRSDFGGEEIARSNFAPAEFRELLALPESERPQAFFNCWTRKEAFVKALGAGLQIPLDSFEVTLRTNEPARFVRGTSADWNLVSFTAENGYQAAIAYNGAPANLYYFTADL